MSLSLQETLTNLLIGSSVLLWAACAGVLGYGVYMIVVRPLYAEVQETGSMGLQGLRQVSLRKLADLNRRLMWRGYESAIQRQLMKGGDPRGYKPQDILGLQEVGLVVGLFFGLFLVWSTGAGVGWAVLLMLGSGLYPLIWLNDQVKKRHLLITRALPYNLDLLTLSVEAGLDFTAALAKVVEKGRTGPLRDELALILRQLKMGKTREEALKNMIARVDLPPLTTFVTSLIQADKMGTSLGKVLRIQSTQLRLERTQRAEKLANEAPVKMLFPLIACIFPTVFMVLFGPILFAFMYGDAMG
ncbi:MAG: type II secretion system F family protein [Myxococcaceae bacterium]